MSDYYNCDRCGKSIHEISRAVHDARCLVNRLPVAAAAVVPDRLQRASARESEEEGDDIDAIAMAAATVAPIKTAGGSSSTTKAAASIPVATRLPVAQQSNSGLTNQLHVASAEELGLSSHPSDPAQTYDGRGQSDLDSHPFLLTPPGSQWVKRRRTGSDKVYWQNSVTQEKTTADPSTQAHVMAHPATATVTATVTATATAAAAASSTADAADTAAAPSHWECARCTMHNRLSSSSCEVCESPRPLRNSGGAAASTGFVGEEEEGWADGDSSRLSVDDSDGDGGGGSARLGAFGGASSSSSASSGGGGGRDEWTCGMCTFLNSGRAPSCDMCSTPRPRKDSGGGAAAAAAAAAATADGTRPPDEAVRERLAGSGAGAGQAYAYGPGGDTMMWDEHVHAASRSSGAQNTEEEGDQFNNIAMGAIFGGIFGGLSALVSSGEGSRSAMRGALEGAALGAASSAMFSATTSSSSSSSGGRGARRTTTSWSSSSSSSSSSGGAASASASASSSRLSGASASASAGAGAGHDHQARVQFEDMLRLLFSRQMGGMGMGMGMGMGGGGGVGPWGPMMMQTGPDGAEDIDHMTFEQLLDRFGIGNDRRAAEESTIAALPTTVLAEDDRDDSGGANQCSICLEDLKAGEEVTRLPCKHGYHHACITEWLRNVSNCPVCKAAV